MSDENDTSVKVGVRVRPLLTSEVHEGSSRCLRADYSSKQIILGNDTAFTFDNVFSEKASQKDVYETSVLPLVDAFFEGFNATVLAYGQTASGKTFTMGSSSSLHLAEEEYGIIPRVVEDIFLNIQRIEASDSNSTYKLHIQYLELYGEEMKDLLDPLSSMRIAIRETPSGEMYLSGVREEQVTSAKEVMRLVEKGSMARTTGSTRMNQSSSRSHAIFTIMLEHSIHCSTPSENGSAKSDNTILGHTGAAVLPSGLNRDGPEVRRCKFHFVDLAGSERAKRTGAQGVRMKEGIDINKGLLVLGNVISALGGENKRAHVPYRDSKLTRLLQDSLGGNSKTVMLCCVSPADADFNESFNAVRYANRARNIQNKPVVNIDPTSLLIIELRKKVQMLAHELLLSRSQPPVTHESDFSDDVLHNLVSNGVELGSKDILLSTREVVTSSTSQILSSPSKKITAMSGIDSSCRMDKLKMINLEKEVVALKEKVRAHESSIDFYSEKCDRLQTDLAERAEELIRTQSERDFFKMKCHDGTPISQVFSEASDGKDRNDADDKQIDVISSYIRQINALNAKIASLQLRQSDEGCHVETPESLLESDLTSNIAKLFLSTEKQLKTEKRILKRIETGTSNDDAEASDDSSVDGDERGDTVDVQDKLYHHKTKLITTEVLDINESIYFKEELVHQLQQSQKQYEAMQEFYESKLRSLCEEMETKELEKQKVLDELQDASLSLQNEDGHVRREREINLKKMLNKKEAELKVLKKQQLELSNLSRVQARSSDQIKSLETDILQLKRQRVSLSKSLQQEKKNFLTSLSSKAKEIDKLKKELSRAISKMTKLGNEKERSNLKINKMLQEESVRRKELAEQRRVGRVRSKGSNSAPPTPRSTRQLLQSLKAVAHKSGSHSLDGRKTRAWIESNARLLVEREAALDDLSLQCEQQLLLLHNKKDLENSKQSLLAESCDNDALSDVDSAITKVANQLKFRNTEITRKKAEIDSGASTLLSQEQIVEQLFQSMGKSADEIRKLLNILFEIIVSGQKNLNSKSAKLRESVDKQRSLQVELEEAVDKVSVQSSNYHREIARIEKDYQSKMMGLFNHSGFNELIQTNVLRGQNCTLEKPLEEVLGDSFNVSAVHDEYSKDGFKALFAVAEERNATLQSQFIHEEMRVHELETFVDECNIERRQLLEKYDSKCQEISFLEEECRMLRDIVSDLKTNNSGGPVFTSPQMASENYNVDLDDETESVLGQYSMLREEINNTGSVPMTVGETGVPNSTIFDRLTNPSYFTGTQKNLFKKDVQVNRAKVQQRKGDSHKKERKKKEDQRRNLPNASGICNGGESGSERHEENSILHDCTWLDTSSTGYCEDETPPHSPTVNTVNSPLPSTRSPSNLNDNVFSRLLNPEKFTGIHRRREMDSPASDIINVEEKISNDSSATSRLSMKKYPT